MISRLLKFIPLIFALSCFVSAQTNPAAPKSTPKFAELEFLQGEWGDGSASGNPGTPSAGEAKFVYELNGEVMVRHSFAEYGKGNRHEDLLYIYHENPTSPLSAIYFDNEGHVIHYRVTTSPNAAVFDSDPSQPGPRFRLSYQLSGKNLNGKFEIATPGSQEYRTYLSWTSVKRK